ncbi:hypothetical protein KO361_03770 [Candidatus Woesearchaeota archaeon]|nr:hypothetical protein [Candidatus Woesearchaeota archaeon]
MKKDELDFLNVKNKYKRKLVQEIGGTPEEVKRVSSSDYDSFKKSFMPKNLSLYEKVCNFGEKILPIKPDKNDIPKIQDAIKTSHLNITPSGTMSFAAVGSISVVLAFIVLGYMVPLVLSGGKTIDMYFFVFFGLMAGLALFVPMTKLPFIIAKSWRMKASNQMVLSIFYVVTYMRHTPNLELAINFAGEHLAPPLSLDFKKIIWDIETGKFDNVNQSLDSYLDGWQKHNPEFVESIHLIQGSLFESSETRRISALDKSLSVILDETFEKMLHYSHDLKNPITTLHMLGIVLPILGLVILPLITAFMSEIKWYHLFALYNLALPAMVFYLGKDILSNRPTGYGGINLSELEEDTPLVKLKLGSSSFDLAPLSAALLIGVFFLFIGFSPLLIYSVNPDFDLYLTEDIQILQPGDVDPRTVVYAKFLDYREQKDENHLFTGDYMGPYGVGANLLSIAIPLGLGLAFGLFYSWKTKRLANLRKETMKLEQEFASALFQLGNRLGDGIPAELAFSKVAQVMQNTKSGNFFDKISLNIVKLGMGVEDAIFDPERGAINDFPSSIVESAMKVFVESSKKGPLIASQALGTVAEYIKSMHRVDERLKDLMADVVSSMRSQINFLTPIIAGIVVGITSMIIQILGILSEKMDEFGDIQGTGTGMEGMLEMFGQGGIPTFFFQVIVGLYVVQITYILSIIINGIENGSDKIGEMQCLATNMMSSTLLYLAVSALSTIGFSFVAAGVVSSI